MSFPSDFPSIFEMFARASSCDLVVQGILATQGQHIAPHFSLYELSYAGTGVDPVVCLIAALRRPIQGFYASFGDVYDIGILLLLPVVTPSD